MLLWSVPTWSVEYMDTYNKWCVMKRIQTFEYWILFMVIYAKQSFNLLILFHQTDFVLLVKLLSLWYKNVNENKWWDNLKNMLFHRQIPRYVVVFITINNWPLSQWSHKNLLPNVIIQILHDSTMLRVLYGL